MYFHKRLTLFASLIATTALKVHCQATCSGTFSPITAATFVAAVGPGWNLGNSLDSLPTEGSWNNPVVSASTFDVVKNAGFKSVRLPVSWVNHFTGNSPDWTVDATWLQRVSDVLDMILDRDMYAIVNVHHDTHDWLDVTASGANYATIEAKFYRLWYQIGTKLGCKSSKLAFEPMNEPPGITTETAAELMKLNDIFLRAINDAQGFNAQRVVTLGGPQQDSIQTSLFFQRPDPTYSNPYALQFHYYSPYAFTSAAWGRTTWGSDEDKATLDLDFAHIRNNFSDIPMIIGEWLVSPVFTENAARWKYYDFLTQTAKKYNMGTFVWDNGNDLLDRTAETWHDKTGIQIHINGLKGIKNSLPDSTTDASATNQTTSAYIFHQAGTSVVDQRLPFIFNGNTATALQAGPTSLGQGEFWYVDGSNVVFTAAFLSWYLSPEAATGEIITLVLSFSAGASIPITIIQWDIPTTPSSSSTASPGNDLSVGVNWKGLGKVAAVAAVKSDGTFLVDDWTIWLPPLQQGRLTFGAQWTWTWSQAGVMIKSSAVDAVVASGLATTFKIEAYPRVPGNYISYTLNP